MTDTQQATEIVEDLFDALRLRDTDRALALLDDRVVWHNVGLPKVRGTSNVGRFLALLAKPTFGFDVTMHNIAADGNVVLTERTDALIWRRLRIEFWVCGTFELRGGKVAVWRDYFDTVDFLKGVARGVFRALIGR
ncbi:epoxide hydrolase [Rhodococcus sp. 06-412-2C]|uniref:limonene-1,2-epoxide hydrolase family protein n=1 Tax=unclassified Rhodococcus (in: high G+C Gram-positive bacteria) TaxID=192944 RepID=UPI000B9AA0A1|nr:MULTISPECIES: limonene-1,2-epoxide hydrolase family protein [unclassified Rhodococcus (in: high G+C Gram-positive bacteria)]OZC91008.1 epoxide hydrolase [Rhodococcus sp. 06-412-2C]OZC91329.1 epoxide hydrolase [Rhodococcus sp. 06-412-2B]OZC91370.1 epoxide hydrolase [Rhodococcus sp. 06-412-2B]